MRIKGHASLDSLEDLAQGLGGLSNHFQKYLKIVQTHSPALRLRLEERNVTGKVHLWRKAHHFRQQMDAVMSVADNPKEARIFLGTYFALQMLHIHFLNIDWLRRESKNFKNRLQIYRHILTRLRFQMRDLYSSYLSSLIRLLSENAPLEGIVFCNVGMILDQDDLDMGVFIQPDIDRTLWNRVVSQISTEFLKYSSKMHFYLAERVAEGTYLTTFDDFKDYLKRSVHNFVLISELLLTEPLLGDGKITQQLEHEIIDHFYYDKGNLRLHEGYLRGMMGEVQELLRFDMSSQWISPKKNALRLIHSTVNMLKSIYGIHEHGSRDIIDVLYIGDPQSAELYENLQDIFSFIEMFFYVYQLLVSVDDSFDFSDEIAVDNLDQVAIVMGYYQLGPVRPALRLLMHYYENMESLRIIGSKILEKVNKHLEKITVFNTIMNGDPPNDYPIEWTRNIAQNILKMFKIYRGMIYWDDILRLLSENNGAQLEKLINSLEELPEDEKWYVFERLLRLLSFDLDSMITTAVMFARYSKKCCFNHYLEHIIGWLMQLVHTNGNRLGDLIRLIQTHPSILTQFLLILSTEQLLEIRRFITKLSPRVQIDNNLKTKFGMLIELLAFSSNNYRRFYVRVAEDRPEIVTYLNDISYLNGISDQLWAELSDAKNAIELKQKLAVYYEYSFCLFGLMAIQQPGDLRLLYGAYHAFFRRYFRWLFRACQWHVESNGNYPFEYRSCDEDDQPIAIFCTGGYAREEAFENDIDLFVLCRESEPEFLGFASKIINDVNRELSRRGIVPHYRFSELLDTYVMPVNVLDDFLSHPRECRYIELSQLVGARLLVGSQSFDLEITEILRKYLFNNPGEFIRDLIGDIEDRRKYKTSRRDGSVNVKEDPGALRDIQNIVTACQAFVGQREPVIWKALQMLISQLPDLEQEFNTLMRTYRFLRFFRDIYSLSLAADDDIIRDRLLSTAHRMKIEPGEIKGEDGHAPKLLKSYRYHRHRAKVAIEKIVHHLTKYHEKKA